MNWFRLEKARQRTILEQTSARTEVPVYAVEKDIWVSILLQEIFKMSCADQIIFKGGTSLSKGWGLIKRFSEDIDLSIQRDYLGYEGDLSKNKIDQLRKAVYGFCHGDFHDELSQTLSKSVIPDELYDLAKNHKNPEKGPVSLTLHYRSVLPTENEYVPSRVSIELSGRGLKEPREILTMNTIVFKAYPQVGEADIQSDVPTIMPERTFLEKVFLLHEVFTKPIEKVNAERRSRHLYDVVQIFERYGPKLWDKELFEITREHRKKYTPIKGVEYDELKMNQLKFTPYDEAAKLFKQDYETMREYMIYEPDPDTWNGLIAKLKTINSSIP